ncbi:MULTISPECIES: MarR family winged helix-turn-helix transcriptional regulator [Lactobacillus]|uniref:MarR family transcriptional regulator n=1 Tax=Lactobacillus xujianguonis TaxID=2495899 RepID=A0A437SWP8_9LACO|nr:MULTISPECIES: helix-turn-helix domain-containing protein [Lactobacillus]RVU71349.1 MarR family transcriptional regulator [Lactobacillus xujianguonis]RVU74052.1 MarR family transcriptional regulator [Lactobacillus xujianguonis]
MKISITEKVTTAIVRGSKGYEQWNNQHHLPDYLAMILYELLMRQELTQKELTKLSDMPKQSINKGIKLLQKQGYLALKVNPKDKRAKLCHLTPEGKKYAQKKMQPLFDLEEKTAQEMGAAKMKQLLDLTEEWNQIFFKYLAMQEEEDNA